MYKEGRVTKDHCKRILRDTLGLISKTAASNIVEKEPNLLSLFDPVTVVGDIHG